MFERPAEHGGASGGLRRRSLIFDVLYSPGACVRDEMGWGEKGQVTMTWRGLSVNLPHAARHRVGCRLTNEDAEMGESAPLRISTDYCDHTPMGGWIIL